MGDAYATASLKPGRAASTPAQVAAAASATTPGKGDGHWTEMELKYIFDMLLKNADEATRQNLARKFMTYCPAPGGGQPHTNYP